MNILSKYEDILTGCRPYDYPSAYYIVLYYYRELPPDTQSVIHREAKELIIDDLL